MIVRATDHVLGLMIEELADRSELEHNGPIMRTGRRRRHRARIADHELVKPCGLDPVRQTFEQTLAGHQVALLSQRPCPLG